MKNLIFLFVALVLQSIFFSSIGQQLNTYNGVYEGGIATYTYITKDGKDIKQGPFNFKSTAGSQGTYSASGNFVNDQKSGNWIYNANWSTYNGEEHHITDVYFSRVTSYHPFIEITKKQIEPYIDGNLTGKASLVFTRKESWGSAGGGQNITIYKKDKLWKNNILLEFTFTITKNNVTTEFVKGKYAVQGDKMLYDGEWTGLIDGNSISVIYDKGIKKSTLIKNTATNNIIKKEDYEVDQTLINKFNDKNNIPVNFNGDNAKLLITKNGEQYDFEVVVNKMSVVYPEDVFKEISGFIGSVERVSPYGDDPDDTQWYANSVSLKNKYLSIDRKKGDFWSIRASYLESIQIFQKINEINIEFIGEPKNFFFETQNNTVTSDWKDNQPSFFNQSMYIKYLFYKGKSKKVLDLFSEADKQRAFEDPAFTGWDLNSFNTVPYYFFSVCLNGDINDVKRIVKDNMDNPAWVDNLIVQTENILPLLKDSSYTEEKLAILKSIAKLVSETKNSSMSEYFSSLYPVKIGQLNWMSNYIEPRKIGINPAAVKNAFFYDKARENDQSLIILNYLEASDIGKFKQYGWRLPTIRELKDLFARNLSDYTIMVDKVYPMQGKEYVYINTLGFTEYRYLAVDDKNRLLIYNATKDLIVYPTANDENLVAGLCKLIKD